MREQIRNIDQNRRINESEKIFASIENLPQFAAAKTVAIYAALNDEPETKSTIERWSKKLSKELLLPKIIDDTTIEFFYIENVDNAKNLQKGRFEILEPTTDARLIDQTEIDIIIIPGVAFTKDGHRLGRGKGYYDRFLKKLSPETLKIGACFPTQIIEKMPCETHDIKVDIVICE